MLRWTSLVLLFLSLAPSALAQTIKTYRGSLGNKHIEMRLTVEGNKVTGSYFYDQFKQDIPLEGAFDSKGSLQLTEGKGKTKTGKFVCKNQLSTVEVSECEWSRMDGTGQAFVFLTEQGIQFKEAIALTPKVLNDRKLKATVSYPQLTSQASSPAIEGFNSLVEKLVQKSVKDFAENRDPNSVFEISYNVLLGTDNVVSVELEEYFDGGAHPTEHFSTVNYSLKANKQLTLADVFRPGDEYKQAIAEFAAKDINRRADEIERADAQRENRQPQKRDEQLMTDDQLPEMDTWGLSPKGFVVYFDFPHVMAVFDKTVVPYGVLARHLSPTGVVPIVR